MTKYNCLCCGDNVYHGVSFCSSFCEALTGLDKFDRSVFQ
jgi:hypothetical protein